LLLYKENKDPKKAAALRELIDYCLTEGQKMSLQMGYIPLPPSVVTVVKKAAGSVQ
jgi:phosphate transport system substrate-binding protein